MSVPILKVENNETLLNLKIQVLLVDYQRRIEEILKHSENQNRSIQVFLTGTFLLIAYALTSEKYVMFSTIPFIFFVLFHLLLFGNRGIYLCAERCVEIEREVKKLLNDDKLLCWESEYGGTSEKWRTSKAFIVNYTLIGTISIGYLLFSILSLHFIYKDPQLGPVILYLFAIAFITLLIVGSYNGLNINKLRPSLKS